MAIFGHLGLWNPCTDRVEIFHGWLRHACNYIRPNWFRPHYGCQVGVGVKISPCVLFYNNNNCDSYDDDDYYHLLFFSDRMSKLFLHKNGYISLNELVTDFSQALFPHFVKNLLATSLQQVRHCFFQLLIHANRSLTPSLTSAARSLTHDGMTWSTWLVSIETHSHFGLF